MNNPIKKIALILILIIILPALIFSIYEINSLNESERVIEGIYNNQLDAILFSVNQYSEDIVSSWRSSLNLLLSEKASNPEYFTAKADSFLNINRSISLIIFSDSLEAENTSMLANQRVKDHIPLRQPDIFRNFLTNNSPKIKRLYTYERGGYSKIEPLQNESSDSSTVFIFLLNDPADLKNICVMVIDPIKFVNDVLGTKIKVIAEDKFIITCSSLKSRDSKDFIFATDELHDQNIQQKKNLWLIPNYQLGILLKGGRLNPLQNHVQEQILF